MKNNIERLNTKLAIDISSQQGMIERRDGNKAA